jgi:kinesin family protein 15
VINILAEVAQTGKQRHIPYRDSRLTFLLQESLGGNAKLAMICAISPASSCRNETLSTLRFAQRAKAMQNKAVVNEETANDVKLLREQIRQLKEELMKMKMNSNNLQENGTTTTTGFSNGWSARRSYNILRLSLGQPMTRSLVDAEPFDEKMEIDQGDDDDDDEGDEPSAQSTPKNDDDDYQPSTIEMKLLFSPSSHSDHHHHHHQAMRNEEIGELLQTVVTKMTETGLDSNSIGQHKAQEENLKSGLPSADLVTSHSELHMITPPELRTSIVSPVVNDSKCSSKANMASGVFSISGKLPLSYSIRSSKAFSSSRDELAASLAHGLEILATQQRRSVQRSGGVQSSFQNTGKTQGSMKCETLHGPSSYDANEGKDLEIPDTGVEGLSPPDLNSPDARDGPSLWQLILEEELNQNSSVTPKTPAHSSEVAEAAALADALRREQAAKEIISLQAAEIEELHCLVQQYKSEQESNAVIHQRQEEKIAQMEKQLEGVLPGGAHEFHANELSALPLEFEMLQQEKFNECLDVNTAAKMKQQSLEEELQKYKTFCDLGEREALQQEITELRSQLQLYLETGTAPRVPTKQQCCLSVTPEKNMLPPSPVNSKLLTSVSGLPEGSPLQDSASSSGSPQGQPEATADKRLEEERKEWDQRESEWIVIVQELREESRNHKQLAEKWKKELEREKRCTREIHDALQLAMEGHARLLNQYAELQEKYTLLLAKVREIRDGVSDMKMVARRSDMNATEAQWFDIQSSQIVAMKIELDREKKIAREEIQALHTQLQDTADAVQAAGELLVRLKEAEEATSIAKNAAAVAEEDAEGMRHEIKKLEKQHGTEVAILQQQLSDALSSKPLSSLCPKCAGMSGHINLECTNETGDDVPSAAQVAAILPSTKETQQKMVAEKEKRKTGTVVESWSCGEQIAEEDEDEDDDEEDTMSFTTAPAFFRHSIGFQFLQNLDMEQFDDNDEFLCETCGEPATNSMRICDSCIPYMGPELRG